MNDTKAETFDELSPIDWLIKLGREEKQPHTLLLDRAEADLARITAERDAAISDLQDAVDYVYNVYGENNETLAAITTAHWRAVIADVKNRL